jgi:hypothetical protein
MLFVLEHPLVLFLVTLILLWIASRIGAAFRKPRTDSQGMDEEQLGLVLGATLTLLALIIGFTFAMAVSRYDQRKNYEEQEANAIGTEYVRLDVLPAADAAKARALLRDYLYERIVYYTSRDAGRLRQARAETARLQSNLWSVVLAPATSPPGPTTAFVLSGMNDVLNSEGYTEAAWRNRVPLAAWVFMVSIAAFCNLLLGYRTHPRSSALLLILPIAFSISFFLIADIDSPRWGVIHVQAQNLESLANSLRLH